jgi:general secretion pathway protein I
MTLVEVLVAFAILGMLAASILMLVGQSAQFIAAAEERAVAGIVADNLMVESLAASAPLERGDSSGEMQLGGRTFSFERVVVEPGVEGVVRIEIRVRAAGGRQVLASATTLNAERPNETR